MLKDKNEPDTLPNSKVPAATLHQLATKHGQLQGAAVDGCEYSAAHNAAAVMHGWNVFEYNYGPVLLTDDEYLKALEAALEGKEPHVAAIRKKESHGTT
jgi:hypothetical protein